MRIGVPHTIPIQQVCENDTLSQIHAMGAVSSHKTPHWCTDPLSNNNLEASDSISSDRISLCPQEHGKYTPYCTKMRNKLTASAMCFQCLHNIPCPVAVLLLFREPTELPHAPRTVKKLAHACIACYDRTMQLRTCQDNAARWGMVIRTRTSLDGPLCCVNKLWNALLACQ